MKKLLPFLLTSVFILQPAFAQTAPAPAAAIEPFEKPVYSPILPVKIKPRQGGADEMSKAAADVEQENTLDPDSLGLYSRVSDGGLGSDIWKNYTSSKLAEDLSKISLNISSPTFTTLLQRALLTSPNPDSYTEDKNKNEAFSSRLTKLVDLGAFDETVLLYKKLEGNIPSAKAALAGVKGIVSTGQMGLACLEEKAVSPELKDNSDTSFWPDLNAFCKILLTTDTPAEEDNGMSFAKTAQLFSVSKKLAPIASLSDLNDRSIIEIISMDKSGLIPQSLFTPENVRTLKPEIISLLLAQSPDSASEKLSLLAVAAEKGMIAPLDFISAFQVQSKLPVPVTGYWQSVLALYGKTQAAAGDAAKSASLKEVLKTINSSRDAALLPFAANFGSLKNIEAFTVDEARQVVALLIRSKINVSGVCFAKAFEKPEAQSKESVTDLDVISALQAVPNSKNPKEATETSKDLKKTDKPAQSIEKAQLHAISLILQEQETEDKDAEKSYEKLLSLTGRNDYVMPSSELMNDLTQASSKQDTGKVILYSLQVLNGQRVSQIHPAALFRISEGLSSVGLSEENRSLAHEVLADLIEYKN